MKKKVIMGVGDIHENTEPIKQKGGKTTRITNAMIKQFISELEHEAENGFSAGVVKSNLNNEAKLVAEGQCSAFKVIAERLKARFKITDM